MRPLPTALALLALSTACASGEVRNGPLAGSVAFVGPGDVADVLEAENQWVDFGRGDLPVYQVELVNTEDEDLKVEVRARWFDDNGIELESATRAWRLLFIPAGSSTPASDAAPNARAVRCRMEVRLHQPLES